MRKLKELFVKYKEIILYLVFGVLTTLVDYLVYKPITLIAPDSEIIATVAKAVAWIAAVVFAFVTNKLFVFEDKRWTRDPVLHQAASFLAARVFTLVLSLLITYFGMKLLKNWDWFMSIPLLGTHASDIIWLIQSVLTVVLNYIFSKLWIFKKDSDEKETQT